MLNVTLKCYTVLSLFMSLFFIYLQYVFQFSKLSSINISAITKKDNFFKNVLMLILLISRFFFSFSLPVCKQIALFSAALMFLFNLVRLHVIMGTLPVTLFFNLLLLAVYIICLVNGFIRLSIFLGEAIQDKADFPIVFTWDYVPKTIRKVADYVNQHTTPSPNTNFPKSQNLRNFGLWATIVMVPLAGYSLYELRLTRIATERAADAAELAAKTAEISALAEQQNADIKAVKNGLMSKEAYSDKYFYNHKKNK